MAAKSKEVQDRDDIRPTADDIEWPEIVFDCAVEAFDDLTFMEQRLFLAMLGIPLDEQGRYRTKQDLSAAIHEQIARDTVRAQAAYDIVIRHIPVPETTPPARANTFTATDFWPTYERLMSRVKTDLSQQALQDLVVMATGKVEQACQKMVAEAAKKVQKVEIVLPDGKITTPKGVLHEKFELACQVASQGFPILLVGPTQSGKTTMARQIATALKLGFAAQSFSGGLTESKLIGRVLPKKGGVAEFVGTPFLKAFEEGEVFLADEIDAGDSNVLTTLNMGIANGEIWLPERDDAPMAKKHKNFRLIAAANTFGFGADARYVGRNALDYATLERFGCGVIYMDYDKRIESSLARAEVCEWAWELRERIRRAQLNREMSTRTVIVIEQMTKAYKWERTQWEERFFCNWSKEERRLIAA